MVEFAKVENTPLSTRIATSLRNAMLSGSFKAGEELGLSEIAEQFGVSRTPVREAFQMLEKDGFLILRMNKSAIVVGVNEHFLQNYYEIRSVLEAQAAANVASNGKDISKLIEIQENAKKAFPMTLENYRDYNTAFHQEIWKQAGNERLQQILSDMWLGSSSGKYMTEKERQMRSLNAHDNILNAIKEHDGEGAFNAMKRHVLGSLRNILRNLNGGNEQLNQIIGD